MTISDNIKDLITHSSSGISIDLDKFESGKYKTLFIFGVNKDNISSVLKYAKQFKCKILNADKIWDKAFKEDPDYAHDVFSDNILKILNTDKYIVYGDELDTDLLNDEIYEKTETSSCIFLGRDLFASYGHQSVKDFRSKIPKSIIKEFKL